jgi:hypothetical protein
MLASWPFELDQIHQSQGVFILNLLNGCLFCRACDLWLVTVSFGSWSLDIVTGRSELCQAYWSICKLTDGLCGQQGCYGGSHIFPRTVYQSLAHIAGVSNQAYQRLIRCEGVSPVYKIRLFGISTPIRLFNQLWNWVYIKRGRTDIRSI